MKGLSSSRRLAATADGLLSTQVTAIILAGPPGTERSMSIVPETDPVLTDGIFRPSALDGFLL